MCSKKLAYCTNEYLLQVLGGPTQLVKGSEEYISKMFSAAKSVFKGRPFIIFRKRYGEWTVYKIYEPGFMGWIRANIGFIATICFCTVPFFMFVIFSGVK